MQFFFYGTLLAGAGNRVAEALHGKLDAGREATARGQLFALPDPAGWYPALIADPAGDVVHGMLHVATANFTPADLAALDAYEGYSPDLPDAGEYRRADISITCESVEVMAQAYLANQPFPPEARPVPGGDFRAFLAEHGLPEYREQ